jgi:arylsulfatase A-like enzyme
VDLLPVWEGKKTAVRELCFEHEGGRAVRDGSWKLVAVGPGSEWELYDLSKDPTELVNLAGKETARVERMAARWEAWAKRTKAVPWPWQPQWK